MVGPLLAQAPLVLFFFVVDDSSGEYILNTQLSYFREVHQNIEHCLFLLAARLLAGLLVDLVVELMVALPVVELSVEQVVESSAELAVELPADLSALFLFREALYWLFVAAECRDVAKYCALKLIFAHPLDFVDRLLSFEY